MKEIGFVGLGAMGSAMAPLLSKADFNVYGYDIKNPKDSNEINIVTSIKELSDKEVIIFMLPDGKIVNKVVQELINFGTKSIMIDMSSSDPNDTLNLGNELSKKNIEFIDAPVSGGVARAITGKLIIMVGGNEVTISKVDKILNVMGSVKRAGPLGAGHAMKSLNNYVSAAGLIASFEALNLSLIHI